MKVRENSGKREELHHKTTGVATSVEDFKFAEWVVGLYGGCGVERFGVERVIATVGNGSDIVAVTAVWAGGNCHGD